MVHYRHFNSLFAQLLNDLRWKDIIWTSNLTIDRIKTLLSITKAKALTTVEGYTCPRWVRRFWEGQSVNVQYETFQYFGNHRFWVFFIWVCYMKTTLMRNVLDDTWTMFLQTHSSSREHYLSAETRERRHTFADHLNYFKAQYEGNTPPENVFRFLVSITKTKFLLLGSV